MGLEGERTDDQDRGGPGPMHERTWVHPSEFRRFVELRAPKRAPQLTAADQTRRAAITAAAMAFLITGLMLLNLRPIPATSTTTSTTAPVVAQLDVAVVSVDVPTGTSTTTTVSRPMLLQASAADNEGAMVTTVLPHSPATAVLHEGDVITTCNTVPVHTASDLSSCAAAAGADHTLCLTLARHGVLVTTNVVLTQKP
jgi:PDZ domain